MTTFKELHKHLCTDQDHLYFIDIFIDNDKEPIWYGAVTNTPAWIIEKYGNCQAQGIAKKQSAFMIAGDVIITTGA